MTKARILANLISDNAELADGQISVAEVVGAAPLASPTFTGNVDLGDNVQIRLGDDNDLRIYHDVSTGNSYIWEQGTGGELWVLGTDIRFANTDFSSNYARFVDGGEVELFYGNQVKLETATDGVDITGDVGATTATITGKTTTDELDLNAIATDISDTAVDVFVYDTSKDSDGGAWRKRTQHTSWYNEALNTATRGSRKEFPAVAVIVAESDTVTIYDGDDPDLPMWFVFDDIDAVAGTGSVCTGVTALNGSIVISRNNTGFGLEYRGGVIEMSFAADYMRWLRGFAVTDWYVATPLTNRMANDTPDGSGVRLVNGQSNDVAMTVLPNAPIDSATGLPVPTIAIASDGGVSVIKDDGTVVDITSSNSSFNVCGSITLNESGRLSFVNGYSLGGNSWVYVFNSLPSADNVITINTKTGSTQDADAFYDARGSSVVYEDLVLIGGQDDINAITESSVGVTAGLTLLDENTTTPANGMVAYTTSDYNTGWMNGNIKLATLSDTDDTDVTGSELVTNGTFDTDYTSWEEARTGTTLSVVSGQLKVERGSTGDYGVKQTTISVVSGKTYVLSFDYDVSNITNSGLRSIYVNETATLPISGYLVESSDPNVGTASVTFTATSTGDKELSLRSVGGGSQSSGDYFLLDNISVRLAEEDRSVEGNGLQVFGSITKNPVASGADLVAYSGFSNLANYLEQPYNSDLDFGTGDFCVIVWVKRSSNGSFNVFASRGGGGVNNRWAIYIDSSNVLKAAIREVGEDTITGSTLPQDTWTHAALVRRNGVGYFYINGVLSASASANRNLTNTVGTLKVGVDYDTSTAAANGSVALLRVSATAPSPEQIAKIYEDEKVLFQENAQATLYGSSDAVTALAYDDSTELLHVGTSAGRSVFHGLRRVDNTTDAVGAAISASNGLVAED